MRKSHQTPITEWPTAKRLKVLLSRKRGLTMARIAEALDVEEHSARALISRLRAEGLPIIKERDGKRRAWLFRLSR